MMIALYFVLCLFIFEIDGVRDEVCYPHVGCFSMKEPWLSPNRPVPPPENPKFLNIRAFFYSRPNTHHRIVVQTWPHIDLNGAPFDPSKMTFFLQHGFENGGEDKWMMDLKDALLKRVDSNVFIGDWVKASSKVSYFQAVANLRMAGRQYAQLINYLIDKRGLDVSRLHLMGHSLGSQISGNIAKAIPGVLRVTGFDVSQPLFEDFDDEVKLTKNDAYYVDAIHADARPFLPDLGFGALNEVADIDYYMNAGHGQPGCSFPKIVSIPTIKTLADYVAVPQAIFKETLLCPHGMSHDFFIEAVNNTECVFWGYNATWSNMLKGLSNAASDGFFTKYLGASGECTYATCSPLGLNSFEWPARGTFVITTRGFSPYCIYESSVVPVKDQQVFLNRIVKGSISFLVGKARPQLENTTKIDNDKKGGDGGNSLF